MGHSETLCPVLTPQYKTDANKLEQVNKKVLEMNKELEHRTSVKGNWDFYPTKV